MEINKNNWFARYFNWIYEEYPENICKFFWGSVLAMVLFFIVVPGRIWSEKIMKKTWDYQPYPTGLVMWVAYILLSALGMNFLKLFSINETLLSVFTIGTLFGIITMGIMVGIIILVCYLTDKYKNYKRKKYREKVDRAYQDPKLYEQYIKEMNKPSFADNLAKWIGAIKGKYCTKIIWKE